MEGVAGAGWEEFRDPRLELGFLALLAGAAGVGGEEVSLVAAGVAGVGSKELLDLDPELECSSLPSRLWPRSRTI
jgi:hypothetical protein